MHEYANHMANISSERLYMRQIKMTQAHLKNIGEK
jgi:hypothetical protein